ncbi:MAG: thiamine pyrophosphate-dependent enzyme [Bdellovibrionales bacterium]
MALDGFTNRSNMEYVEQIYEQFLQDPNSVDPQWKYFFEGMKFAEESGRTTAAGSGAGALDGNELNVYRLIRAYRDFGHLKADLDPLKIQSRSAEILDLAKYNLSQADLNTTFKAGQFIGKPNATLKELIDFLEATYCGTITAQVTDCPPEERLWLYQQLEDTQFQLKPEQKIDIYKQLCRTESLEKFIHSRYVGMKRFSIEGGDSLIPMLCYLADNGTAVKMEEMVIGMAHRGRINVLANFLGKELENILSEFEGNAKIDTSYEGDVKYHLGFSADRKTPHGNCHLSLAFNPSHLEFVGPVAQGMVRVKQRTRKDTVERKKVVPVVIHGDAAFTGQGVVTETLQLSNLDGYKVGGTIHVILNNQVGFTTNPRDSRSTRYSSDVAKGINAPVILVNGDDVEACVKAMEIAMRF